MDTNNLTNKIEAILFYLAEPVEISFLARTLEVPKKEVISAVNELAVSLEARGIRIIRHNDEVTIVTAPELSKTMEKIVKEERQRDLGRAGIETLSIIAYKGPVSKKEIEYIRGVNCQWALRSLLLRGLIEKKGSETDTRVILYTLTSETLRYLGLSHITDLPQYQEKQKQLEVLENTEGLEKEQYG